MAIPDGGRIVIDAPDFISGKVPIRLILYALPNGNSIEWTAGATTRPGEDWHYGIQNIAAQIALLRVSDRAHDYVVAYLEAPGKSWPAWSADHKADAPRRARDIVQSVEKLFALPGRSIELSLIAHSGGGSFLTRCLVAEEPLPAELKRISYIDGYYGCDDEPRFFQKLHDWLIQDSKHKLVVTFYDDHQVELNGKRLYPFGTGWGSANAAHRMLSAMFVPPDMTHKEYDSESVRQVILVSGGAVFVERKNPQNVILHTRLVEWNGLLRAMALGDASLPQSWVPLTESRSYDDYQPPRPLQFPATRSATTRLTEASSPPLNLPPRQKSLLGGHAWMAQLNGLRADRQQDAIRDQILSGNVRSRLRDWKTIHVEAVAADGQPHVAEFRVLPDYLDIGSDDDFIRIPMLPATAQQIADALHCCLPTRKMVDDIYEAAEIKLDPQPMTENREAVQTFVDQNDLIEFELGALRHAEERTFATTRPAASPLIAGTKKDIVITPRLATNPHKVAIYGWHTRDGRPIQPLTTVHSETYVDYSHGVRLIANDMTVDYKPATVQAILADPTLCVLLSDEGPVAVPRYP